jgi:hypothetical protein
VTAFGGAFLFAAGALLTALFGPVALLVGVLAAVGGMLWMTDL